MQRLVFSCAAILSFVGLATVCAKPVDVPWQAPNAGHRQVVEVQSDTPRQNGVVEFVVRRRRMRRSVWSMWRRRTRRCPSSGMARP
jgi:hypothetical protein